MIAGGINIFREDFKRFNVVVTDIYSQTHRLECTAHHIFDVVFRELDKLIQLSAPGREPQLTEPGLSHIGANIDDNLVYLLFQSNQRDGAAKTFRSFINCSTTIFPIN